MVSIQIINGDCLAVMRGMEANSFDAIITDPPYFRVKSLAWDRQWETRSAFIAWIGELCEQWQRLLRPNGSLYVFAAPRMAAYVEVEVGKWFNVLNHIVWQKADKRGGGRHRHQHKEGLRAFFPQSERIIFAEHFGADNIAKGEAGYEKKCDELRGFVFEPLRKYFADELERSGLTIPEVMDGMAARGCGRYMFARHTFTRSQWQLPTRETYEAARDLFNSRPPADYLRREYDYLRREYDDLRPFFGRPDRPYTDVWTEFPTVDAYRGKHPCEKPLTLMEHIVAISTKPGAVVLDCFAGSGSTGIACRNLGRDFVGIELDEQWANKAKQKLARPPKTLF